MADVGVTGPLTLTGLPAPPPLVIETHSALKPVDLGFLDFTRRETRRAVCQREVELNRRPALEFAPWPWGPSAHDGGRQTADPGPLTGAVPRRV